MEIFTEPRVFLLSRPALDMGGLAGFVGETGNAVPEAGGTDKGADLLVEAAGRTCYCSFKDLFSDNWGFLSRAREAGHGSVFEHANFTFGVARCSRGFTHQMVRHRAGFAYSQESTHFIKYSREKARFYVDRYALEGAEDVGRAALASALEKYEIAYTFLRNRDTGRHDCSGAARQLLPQAIESKLVFTANVRALRHFIEERCNSHNTMETRLVAAQTLAILKTEAPASVQDLKMSLDEAGAPSAETGRRKL
jgi:thymidylate synthase (FAD)